MLIIPNSQKASRAAQNALAGDMRPRVWDPRNHYRYLLVTIKHALYRFHHNHVECYRFHQWFHINLPAKKCFVK